MVYITGDTHGDFQRIKLFCKNKKTTLNDVIIILGDAGINFYGGAKDATLKHKLSKLPINIFCIHGNHEKRPDNIKSYDLVDMYDGKVYVEKAYPNIIFAIDGEIYNIGGYSCIAIGGAYSVDKEYRLYNGWNWFPDEQPSSLIKHNVEKRLCENYWNIDIVFSHTCPLKYEPYEWFVHQVDERQVDKSTEMWLDKIENRLEYKYWYCGHFHGEKIIDNIEFMYESIKEMRLGGD